MSEKKRKKRRTILAVAIIAAAVAASIIIALAMSFSSSQDGNNGSSPAIPAHNETAPAAPSAGINGTTTGSGGGEGEAPVEKTPVNVLSSPSALPFVEKWVAQYNSEGNLGNVQVSYSDRADDAKIPLLYSNISAFLADHSADIAIAGRPVAAANGDGGSSGNFTYAGSVFLPVGPQAVAVVYNIPAIPDVPSGLKLDPPTLNAVLSGNATYWDDPRIKSLNPDTSLPHEQIVVVHEGTAGSSSDMLGRYLAPATSNNNSTTTTTIVAWPKSSLVADSASSLSAMVRQTPYSIGYVDFAFAAQTRMTYASLQNSDGKYVLPSADSVGAAVRNGTVVVVAVNSTAAVQKNDTNPENPMSVTPPTISIGHLGNDSYPLVGFYYAAFSDRAAGHGANETAVAGDGSSKSAATVDFVRWIVGKEGQQILQDMQYPPVYEQNKDLKAFADKVLGEKTPAPVAKTFPS